MEVSLCIAQLSSSRCFIQVCCGLMKSNNCLCKFPLPQVKESDMSKEVIEDYEASLEYASAESLIKMKKRGDQRLYLVK